MGALGVDKTFQLNKNVEESGWFCVHKGRLHETQIILGLSSYTSLPRFAEHLQ